MQRAADVAFGLADLQAIVIVAPARQIDQIEDLVGSSPHRDSRGDPVSLAVVAGGVERQDSVRHGLAALPGDIDTVLVHDAARPLAAVEVYDRVLAALGSGDARIDAVIPALPVVDTVKEVDATGTVVRTPDRSSLRAVQTPQGFRRSALEGAHRAALATAGPTATDDAALIECNGGTVVVVPGDLSAEKITTIHDLERAEHRLASDTGAR